MTDWPQIVEQHGPAVWKTAWRLLKNHADAADCFQETFISALELSRTEPIRHWPAVLRRLATVRAIEQLRQRCRELKRRKWLDESKPDRKASEPGRIAEANELAEHLRVALVHIDVRLSEVFCLACLEGFSYQEIAEHLGTTVNHVGVLLHRAKAALRDRLRGHMPTPASDCVSQEVQP